MARADGTTSTPRPRKTAAEKASAELEKANTRKSRADQRVTDLSAALDEAKTEQERAQKFYDYAAANPDLPNSSVPGEDGETEQSTV